MFYSDNPAWDYDRYCEEREAEKAKCPVCCCCDEHITDDFLFYIEDMTWCEECMKNEFRRLTEDFMED